MKRIIALVMALLMIGTIFVGCGKEKVCDSCQQTYKGKTQTITYMGQKLNVCDICYEEYKQMQEIYGQIFG